MRANTDKEGRVPSGGPDKRRDDLGSFLEHASRSYKARRWLPLLTVLLCKLLNSCQSR